MIRVSIIGASGYAGGELIRILLSHPEVELDQLVSRNLAGKSVWKAHPNLRNVQMRFANLNFDKISESDVVFTAVPHTAAMKIVPQLIERGVRVVDLSADFRLHSAEDYEQWYETKHTAPELLENAVYGIPELHREEMKAAQLVSGAGCEATAAILALAPLRGRSGRVVVDVKIGGSGAGRTGNPGTHYPERANAVRPYAPARHRHAAEILQETGFKVDMSAHAVGMVRGILATVHVLNCDVENAVQMYREYYRDSPFVRITPNTPQFLPNPKYVLGSNYCDIGIVESEGRLVVISALDNLVKGAAGQAIQCMNIMFGLEETMGLEAQPIYPI